VKNFILQLIYKGWPGTFLRLFDRCLRSRPKVLGLTNPVHMAHVVTEQAGGVYLSDADSYIAVASGRDTMVRFDPDLFEPEITYLMQTLIRPDDVILDIGANIGFHTVTMARAAHRGHLYAFEPVPEMAEQHSRNCAINRLENVTLYNFALGKEDAELEMRVNVGGEGLQGTSTFIADNDNVTENPDRYEFRTMKVRRLDDIVGSLELPGRIGFVKIDTEGFDTHVLEGGMETIREHRPIVIVEAHSTRLAQAGKSWRWFLDTFPDHHILIAHALTRAKPYLHLEPLTPDEPEISVNLLMLPRPKIRTAGD
jgi:FkbM family methyltransferase